MSQYISMLKLYFLVSFAQQITGSELQPEYSNTKKGWKSKKVKRNVQLNNNIQIIYIYKSSQSASVNHTHK